MAAPSCPTPLFAGDGEDLLAAFTERLIEAKRQLAGPSGTASRRKLLLALAQVPGVYVPQVRRGVAAELLVAALWLELPISRARSGASPALSCPTQTRSHRPLPCLFINTNRSCTMLSTSRPPARWPASARRRRACPRRCRSKRTAATPWPAARVGGRICMRGRGQERARLPDHPMHVAPYAGWHLQEAAAATVCACPAAPLLRPAAVVSKRMAWENIYMAEVVRSCPEMCRQEQGAEPAACAWSCARCPVCHRHAACAGRRVGAFCRCTGRVWASLLPLRLTLLPAGRHPCRFCLASYLTLPFRPAPLEGSLIPSLEVRRCRRVP